MISVTYLTMDGIGEGVGASQVLPYVEGLAARGTAVELHSFEHRSIPLELEQRLARAGVEWHAHRFHSAGAAAGLARVLHGATLVHNNSVVHARSDLPAASALLARCKTWVWDVRSFWADQRIATHALRRRSPQERVLRAVESASAARASIITTLTAAAIDILVERHGDFVRDKATVIPTCVDLDRFPLAPMPDPDCLQLLLSGSFNGLYDLDLTLGFVEAVQRLRPANLTLLRAAPSPWDGVVAGVGGRVASAPFAEMPSRLRASHVGLSICRTDDSAAIAGAAPTKIAEFLATGRPVVVNPGLGDLDGLVGRYGCGVVLAGESRDAMDDAAESLSALINDETTPNRCRAAAAEHFDLEQGVTRLLDGYRRSLDM